MLPSCWHDDLYQLLQNAGIPVVMLDQIPASMRHFPVDCVISDNYRGGALLAEHLLEKGHTKVWIMEQYLDSYTCLLYTSLLPPTLQDLYLHGTNDWL